MSEILKIDDYKIIKKLGSGTFGIVYKAQNINDNKIYALKIEKKTKSSRLKVEKKIYELLKEDVGFPKIHKLIDRKDDSVFIMDYLGPSLEDLFEFCDYNFSLKTILMIGLQIVNRIESLHKLGYLHRDIKPDNFLIGTHSKKSRVYMIDLGLSKKYIDKNQNHISIRYDTNFTGSFRYSSIRNHKGIEQSRRDDLESIGYMLIFFLKKKLPWQGLKGSTKSKRSSNIFNVKNSTSLEKLCEGIPREFLLYMKYARILKFKQEPDYNLLRDLFINLFRKEKYKMDLIYDWNIIAKKKKKMLKNSS